MSAAINSWYADFDGSWSEWKLPNGAVDGSALLTFNSFCASEPAGRTVEGQNEYTFSFSVGSNCFLTGDVRGGSPISFFTWEYLDEAGIPVDFACLNVRGTASTTGAIEGEIVFQPALITSTASTSRTSDQLTDVDSVDFALIAPDVILEGVGELQGEELGVLNGYSTYFDIEISIRPCSFDFDGPDIEHYRRMAEQATALPDTK